MSRAAVAAYRRAVERAPENAILLNNLAYLLAADPAARDEAVRLAERAQGLAPQSPVVADTLGWLLYLKGDLPRAEALLAAAAKAAPGHPRGPLSPRDGLRQAGEGAGGAAASSRPRSRPAISRKPPRRAGRSSLFHSARRFDAVGGRMGS